MDGIPGTGHVSMDEKMKFLAAQKETRAYVKKIRDWFAGLSSFEQEELRASQMDGWNDVHHLALLDCNKVFYTEPLPASVVVLIDRAPEWEGT